MTSHYVPRQVGVLAARAGRMLLLIACACDPDSPQPARPGESSGSPSPSASPTLVRHRAEATKCLQRIHALRSEPGLAGDPSFERSRTELLARAKGTPVFFLVAPEENTRLSSRARHLRKLVTDPDAKAVALYRKYPSIVRDPEVAREVLLTDGYLYSDKPSIAFALTYVSRLEDLFSDDVIWLQRGEETHELHRKRDSTGRYYEHQGELQGERAALLFLDRVSKQRESLSVPLHRDVRALLDNEGASGISVLHWTQESAVVELQYRNLRVPALLRSDGAGWRLVCRAPTQASESALTEEREAGLARNRLVSRLRQSIDMQVRERLPFDEPRTELGQQDGELRGAWRTAYRRGRRTYEFNEDHYRVFNRDGQPAVPQVCIDFIVDTVERAAGTWWQPLGQARIKRKGSFEISDSDIGSRRRVEDFMAFARSKPEWFDVYDVPVTDRVPLRRRRRFYSKLESMSEHFQAGDIVVIYGLRDDEEPHYHSFFVYRNDPFTGMPIQLASNAARPQIRSWEAEMLNAPRRTIRARIRPQASWLAEILSQSASSPESPRLP